MIKEGKLWRVAASHCVRAQLKVECVTKEEAVWLVEEEHQRNGHWQQDAVKKALLDQIWSPGLNASIVRGIKGCGVCENFGGTHLHLLLDPITRQQPFELLAGDYLALPVGKGGYHKWGYSGSKKMSQCLLVFEDQIGVIFWNNLGTWPIYVKNYTSWLSNKPWVTWFGSKLIE